MQAITIDGFLSKDAEQRQAGGSTVTVWNVPVRQGYGESERTNWFRVNIWGKRADFASKAVKGDFIVVTGTLKIGEYNGKPTMDIDAADFTMRSAKPREDAPRGNGGSGFGSKSRQAVNEEIDDDPDIPFISNRGIW